MTTLSSFNNCSACPSRKFNFCRTMLSIVRDELDTQIIKHEPLAAHKTLFRQGEIYDGLFILQSGWMMITRVDDEGQRQVLKFVLPGDVLGFQPDMHGPAIYTAVAVQNSVICSIPSAIQLCSKSPELALKLAWVSSCEMLLMEMYLAKITQHPAIERIAFMVLELFRRMQQRGMNIGLSIPFYLKQEDIADMLGLTIIHVNRTLHNLRERGIFEIKHRQLTITNYEALSQFVGTELEMFNVCEFTHDRN